MAPGTLQVPFVLHRYFVESVYAETLQSLLRVPTIAAARIDQFDSGFAERDKETGFIISSGPDKDALHLPGTHADSLVDQSQAMGLIADTDTGNGLVLSSSNLTVLSFEIDSKAVEDVRRECIRIEFPMLEEYEFRKGRQRSRPLHSFQFIYYVFNHLEIVLSNQTPF